MEEKQKKNFKNEDLEVGWTIKVTKNPAWNGVYKVNKISRINDREYDIVIVNHPKMGLGGFYFGDFEIIGPPSKLERALL